MTLDIITYFLCQLYLGMELMIPLYDVLILVLMYNKNAVTQTNKMQQINTI